MTPGDPKNEKIDPRVTKMAPKYTKSEPFGAKRSPKGSQRESKGSLREPKGSQKGAKGSQREPKACQKGAKGSPKCLPKSIFGTGRKNDAKKALREKKFWTHFGVDFPSKIDEQIDAKIDAEKVMNINEILCEHDVLFGQKVMEN